MNVCLYGASSTQIDQKYVLATEQLGEALAKAGHGLVYGGGAFGLMGAAARGMTRCGGTVVGVAPSFFQVDGVLYEHCTEMVYTETMRERKQIMEERSDAFIVAPGGIGTYEEFFEIYTLKQLGRHSKPIIIFNIDGYYDDLLNMLRHTVDEKFMQASCLDLCAVAATSDEVMALLSQTADAADVHQTKYI